jgi:hypothetical protein
LVDLALEFYGLVEYEIINLGAKGFLIGVSLQIPDQLSEP